MNEKGEEAMAKGKYKEAIGFFDKGIEVSDNEYLLYGNRSEAHMKQGNYDQALADAEKTIYLRPNWFKVSCFYFFILLLFFLPKKGISQKGRQFMWLEKI